MGVGVGGHADDGADFRADGGIHEGTEIAGEIARGFRVLDDAVHHGLHEIQMEAMLDGRLAEEHGGVFWQESIHNAVLRVADEGGDDAVSRQLVLPTESPLEARLVRAPVEAEQQHTALRGSSVVVTGGSADVEAAFAVGLLWFEVALERGSED